MNRLWVPGPLPGMNEIIDAKATVFGRGRKKMSAYTAMKKRWDGVVALHALAQRFQAVESGHFTYLIREPSKRRDPSNVIAGAVKILEDGLQKAGLLPNDGWKQVLGINPVWMVDSDRPGVSLFVTDSPMPSDVEYLVALDDTWREKSKTRERTGTKGNEEGVRVDR